MTPRLIAFYEGAMYARLARVLAHTAAQHCSQWDRRIVNTQLFTEGQRSVDDRVRKDNAKLLRWTTEVEQAPDGTPMLLVDCDVMIVRPIDDLWDRPFDIAYTARDPERTKLPLNAGVVFVRATDAARRFLRAWYEATVPFKQSEALWHVARKHYGACDQAGLATLLKTPPPEVHVVALPCREWNCEDSEWGRFDPARTRLVHVKGALRKAILGQSISAGRKRSVLPLAKQWQTFEREASA